MRSFIKIYGPGVQVALSQIENLVESEPLITSESERVLMEPAKLASALLPSNKGCMSEYLCGDWTVSFRWEREPSVNAIMELLDKLDTVISQTKARYTITTVSDPLAPPTPEAGLRLPSDLSNEYAVTYIKFYGPPIAPSLKIMDEVLEKFQSAHGEILQSKGGGAQLGVYDYAVIWKQRPEAMHLNDFLKTLDMELGKINLMYDIVTKSYSLK